MSQNSPSDIEVIRKGSNDLFYFCTVVLADAFPDKFHDWGRIQKRMCDFLTSEESSQKYLSAFRLSFKTTALLGFCVWNFCWSYAQGKADSLIYNTATKDNAYNFSGDFRHIIENCDLLHEVFPNIPKEASKYKSFTKNRVQLGHVKIDFASFETTLVSRHYPKWINDDLENDTNSESETERKKVIRKWRYQKAVLMKLRKKNMGLEIETGTPYHHQGLNWLIRQMPHFSKLIIPALDKDHNPTFPELYTKEDLDDKKREMGNTLFSSQFMLRPLAAEDALCREEWLQYWEELPDLVWRSIVIDPGGSDPKINDPTAVTVVDTDEKGDMYVVHAGEYWMTSMEMAKFIVQLKDDYHPDDLRIEKDKASTVVTDTLRHLFPLLNISYVEHKHRAKGDAKRRSGTRIWRLRQYYEGKRIFYHRSQKPLIDQTLEFPASERDDLLDSLAYHVDIRRVPSRDQPNRLPSGAIFRPNIPKDFEEELDKLVAYANSNNEGIINDHSW